MYTLKKYITGKSIRKRYIYLAIVLSVAVIGFAWFTGAWVNDTARKKISHIENRLQIAELNHQLRGAVIAVDNILDIYLLSPTAEKRQEFQIELERVRGLLQRLESSEWDAKETVLPLVQGLQHVREKLGTAGQQIMEIRETADLMYPAMRIANGEMLGANQEIMSNTGLIRDYFGEKGIRRLKRYERKVYESNLMLRESWLKVINAYRLFLINRTGSLFEKALQNQLDDVELLYTQVTKYIRELAQLNARYELELDIAVAIDGIHELVPAWYRGFRSVVDINKEGNWRGDIPLVVDVINPMFTEFYTKLDQIDTEIKNASDEDIVEQTQISKTIIQSLWGMGFFVIAVSLLSLVFLELDIIRPIAKVSKILKAEAKGIATEELPHASTSEIRDLTEAFRYLLEQVHSRQMALEHIAMHDALTSLPNRALLMDSLNQSILTAQQQKRSLALLMLDLDRFKEINDTLGHQTGDTLLQQVGERLRNVLRDSDTVARLGGDEFAILLPNVNDTNALRVAAAVNEKLEKVYEVNEHSLYVGVSIGVAVFPQHGETTDSLLQHADVAMYIAKRSNTGISLYDVNRDDHSVTQLSVLSDLRNAVEKEEFVLHYQPKLSMRDSSIIGAEALIRWKHPQQGLIQPDDFINVAEQTGLIKRISNWVLGTAIRDCQRLHQKGHKVKVSVNLSVWDIQDANLGLTITQKLEKWGLPAKYLTLEITERVMMAEPERALQVLTDLDNMGVQVVIDDFGTGFSSLVYLKQLPVSMLKVDKSFVIDMMSDESDAAIVHSIIEMAHNLGLQVVAEGVQNDQTWSWLKSWGCDYAQGFYISHPLMLADFEHYLETFAIDKIPG